MKTARIVVLTIALSAGGVAAYLVSGSDNRPAPTAPAAQLQTVDVLVAKSDIGLGQTVTPDDMQWQTWPAATASNTFIRRNERPDATTQGAGSVAGAPPKQHLHTPQRTPGRHAPVRRLDPPRPLHRRRTDPRAEAGQGQRLRL